MLLVLLGVWCGVVCRLRRGEVLHLIVGQASTKSSSTDSGGAGGTFVALNGRWEVVAGGWRAGLHTHA